MINRPSAYRGKLNRKGHRKSRLGCGNCKRRRVKCDEVKPACGPCTSHLIACNFEVEPSSHENLSPLTSSVNHNSTLGRDFTYISSSQNGFQPPKRKHTRQRKLQSLQSPVFEVPAQRSMLALGDRPFEFSMLDVELFHNYMSSTSLTLGDDETSRQLLQIQLPRLGFSFHYVLRLLLAFSGFHLARMPGTGLRQNQTPTQPYLERAQLHYTIALSQLIPSVTRLNTTTFRALYAASSFMCFCTLARAPQPGDYLLFSTSGRVELPTLLHGVRSILETREQVPVEVDASSGSSPSTENVTASSEPASHSSMIFEDSIPMTARFSMPLDHIRHLIFNESEQSGIGSETYWKVYGDLVSTFQLVRSESRTKGDKFPIIFGWLYRLPNAFIVDLQERRPISLILFAFFAVLLKDLSCYWFIDGWPEHIMIGIQQNLDKKYESWILWLIAAIE